MDLSGKRFAVLLTEAIKEIRRRENKTLSIIQDELGYGLDRGGGSAIQYWRRGNIPQKEDIEKLARLLIPRTGFNRRWLEQFLEAAEYPHIESLCQKLFPDGSPSETGYILETLHQEHQTLIGREKEITDLMQALQNREKPWRIGIEGLGGIGKTALALHVVRLCRENKLFDTIIWLNASADIQEGDGHLTLETVLNSIVYSLAANQLVSLSTSDKVNRLRMILRKRRLLLVLDNLETARTHQDELLNQLAPVLNPTKALFISRHRFKDTIHTIPLKGLTKNSALDFIRQEAKIKNNNRVKETSSEALSTIIEATGGSPLALKLMVSQLIRLPLKQVLAQLQKFDSNDKQNDYAHLYQNIFTKSWELLSLESQQILLTLAQFLPGIGGEFNAIAYCSQLPSSILSEGIDDLWQSALLEIEESSSFEFPRYFLHPLTHNFVTSEIAILTSGPEQHRKIQQQAAENYVRFYLEVFPQTPNLSDDVVGQEIVNITQALNLAHQFGMHAQQIRGTLELYQYWEARGQYQEAVMHLTRAVEAARWQNDLARLAHALHKLGSIQWRIGQLSEAEAAVEEGLSLARQLNDKQLIASTLQTLGSFAGMWRGDHDLVEKYSKEALELAHSVQDHALVCKLLNNLGNVVSEQGNLQQAINYWMEAIAAAQKGNFPNEFVLPTFLNIGIIEIDRGQFEIAETFLNQGLKYARELFVSDSICRFMIQLGQAKRLSGYPELANGYFIEGLRIARETGHIESIIMALQHLGDLEKEEKNYAAALIHMNEALALAREANILWEIIVQQIYRGELFLAQEKIALAESDLVEALTTAEEASMITPVAAAAWPLAQVALAKNEIEKAKELGRRSWEIFHKGGFRQAEEIRDWMREKLGVSLQT